ncbi:TPA: cation transporting ATPase C-terminal domain-containing protein, partial [Enterococcus faecalis]|nr:cation transporting ATPase C-terminal domain-containing protein [Enterococcus faecalis]
TQPFFSKSLFTNPKAFWIIGIMVILQLILTYVPLMQSIFYTANLSLLAWVISIVSGMIILFITEVDKYIRNVKRKKKRNDVLPKS